MRYFARTSTFVKKTSGVALFLPLIIGCASKSSTKESLEEDRWSALSDKIENQEARIENLSAEISALRSKIARLKRLNAAPVRRATKINPPPLRDDEESAEDAAEGTFAIKPFDDSILGGESVADSSQESLYYYYQGLDKMERHRYEKAVSDFQRFLSENPHHVYTDRALYLVGRAYFLNDEFALALTAFGQLLREYPSSFRIPAALFLKAQCLEQLGQREEARGSFRNLIKRFPADELAPAASRALVNAKSAMPASDIFD